MHMGLCSFVEKDGNFHGECPRNERWESDVHANSVSVTYVMFLDHLVQHLP